MASGDDMGDGESDDPCSEDYNMTFVLPDHFEGSRWIESRDEVVSSGQVQVPPT